MMDMSGQCSLCRQTVANRHCLLGHRLTENWGAFRRAYCPRCLDKMEMLAVALLADTDERCETARRISIALDEVMR